MTQFLRDSVPRLGSLSKVALGLLLASNLIACEEKQEPKPEASVEEKEPPPEEPKVLSPPSISIDASGVKIRYSPATIQTVDGRIAKGGDVQLLSMLDEEKEFISDKEISIQVDRKAEPAWVAALVNGLSERGAATISVSTKTRGDLPQSILLVGQDKLARAPSCTLIGTVTDDLGTAVWRLQGGAARKRNRGMGGPDLTMTADTILSMSESCDSQFFAVGASKSIEWGPLYDLAAAGISKAGKKLKQGAVVLGTTAGTKVELSAAK